jgi:hypothetical protein
VCQQPLAHIRCTVKILLHDIVCVLFPSFRRFSPVARPPSDSMRIVLPASDGRVGVRTIV